MLFRGEARGRRQLGLPEEPPAPRASALLGASRDMELSYMMYYPMFDCLCKQRNHLINQVSLDT